MHSVLWPDGVWSYNRCMHIAEVMRTRRPTFSLEFFPPKSPKGWERLFRVISGFEKLGPDFISVTYGAAGSTREQTNELVRRVSVETSLNVVAHLTCICHTRVDVDRILDSYASLGIGGIMALGGDAPPALAECYTEYDHAVDLVRQIRAYGATGKHPGGGFGIGVAGFPEGHPATPNRVLEIQYLKEKVDAGADYICTQLFFENRDFYDFRERCAIAGISVPIVAGIMPVTSRASYERIPNLALGSRYPSELIRMIGPLTSDDDIEKAGVEWTTRQCEDLLTNGVDGIHFYTLNRSRAVRSIWNAVAPTPEG